MNSYPQPLYYAKQLDVVRDKTVTRTFDFFNAGSNKKMKPTSLIVGLLGKVSALTHRTKERLRYRFDSINLFIVGFYSHLKI